MITRIEIQSEIKTDSLWVVQWSNQIKRMKSFTRLLFCTQVNQASTDILQDTVTYTHHLK